MEVEWSSHTTGIYVFTSRGMLKSVVVHTAVQWFASLCRLEITRAIPAYWRAWRARLVHSQAVEVEWSSHTTGMYVFTSRGMSQSVVVHTTVLWFASLCRLEITRSIPAWASRVCGRMMGREWRPYPPTSITDGGGLGGCSTVDSMNDQVVGRFTGLGCSTLQQHTNNNR